MDSPKLEDMMCPDTCVMCFFGNLYADNGPDLQQFLTPIGILELIRGKNNFIRNHISVILAFIYDI